MNDALLASPLLKIVAQLGQFLSPRDPGAFFLFAFLYVGGAVALWAVRQKWMGKGSNK